MSTAPVRRFPFLAGGAVIVAVFTLSIYANLSFAVTNRATFRYFPPFLPNVDRNLNRHLGAEYFNIAQALVAGEGFSNPFPAKTGPTAWMPPLLPVFEAALLWSFGGNRDAAMTVVIFCQLYALIATGLLVLTLAWQSDSCVGVWGASVVFVAALCCDFKLCFQVTHDCWLVLLALDTVVAGFCWLEPLRRWWTALSWGLVGGICALISPMVALIALLLPAVQKVRQISVTLRCANNLRQVGLALHSFHSSYKLFPSNGGWDGKQTIPSADGSPPFTPQTFDYTTNGIYQWGVGDPTLRPRDQTGCWAFSILPYVEQEAVHKQQAWANSIHTYICPGRRQAVSHSVVADDGYGKFWGGGWTWGKTDYAVNLFAFESRPVCRSTAHFADGLSNTVLLGEKAFNPEVEQPLSWYWDEPYFLGGSKGTSRGGFALLKDGADILYHYKENWGSPHLGGVQFLFGDGGVRSLEREIDPTVFSAMLTPDGGEAVRSP